MSFKFWCPSWWSPRRRACSVTGCWAWSTLRMWTRSSRLRDTCKSHHMITFHNWIRLLHIAQYELGDLSGIAHFTCMWQWCCLALVIKDHLLNYFENRLDRFEKTNEMLINFNGLSNVRLQQMNERFLLHTRTLVEMKKDLDSIFRRIR